MACRSSQVSFRIFPPNYESGFLLTDGYRWPLMAIYLHFIQSMPEFPRITSPTLFFFFIIKICSPQLLTLSIAAPTIVFSMLTFKASFHSRITGQCIPFRRNIFKMWVAKSSTVLHIQNAATFMDFKEISKVVMNSFVLENKFVNLVEVTKLSLGATTDF